ncbi:MAG: hypothetical protein ACFFCO_05270, partial [Promethearchaeota archaeon]
MPSSGGWRLIKVTLFELKRVKIVGGGPVLVVWNVICRPRLRTVPRRVPRRANRSMVQVYNIKAIPPTPKARNRT